MFAPASSPADAAFMFLAAALSARRRLTTCRLASAGDRGSIEGPRSAARAGQGMKAWQREHDLNALQALANLIAALLRQAELAAEDCGEAEIERAQACAALDAALLRQLAARDGSERAATELSARLCAVEAELGECLYWHRPRRARACACSASRSTNCRP
ncbi:hypothetical protein [Lysobacter firmicutimachus]|uniref:Uncharacterized protein n=1 Tax=Lysobacter firmicutimachus TaxID=1792846 RepID=A0ABU8D2V9_9GAMM